MGYVGSGIAVKASVRTAGVGIKAELGGTGTQPALPGIERIEYHLKLILSRISSPSTSSMDELRL